MTTYTTKQGDTWDLIAFRLTGSNDQTPALMLANPEYTNLFIFSAGVTLNVPDFDTIEDLDSLPPWRREDLMEEA